MNNEIQITLYDHTRAMIDKTRSMLNVCKNIDNPGYMDGILISCLLGIYENQKRLLVTIESMIGDDNE